LGNFGAFQGFWKSQEIQDGCRLEDDEIIASYNVTANVVKFLCHSLNVLGVKVFWGEGGGALV